MTNETAPEFARRAALIWGYGYQTKAANHFNVSDRTVRRWCAGTSAVPQAIMDELRKFAEFTPPPNGTTEDDDRDDACYDAIEPELNQLAERAVAAGWSIAEVLTAILAITVSEMKHRAGDTATRKTLEAAILMMDE